MRRLLRVVLLVVLAFLIQSIVLPYLKLGGVQPDLLHVTLLAIGLCGRRYMAVTTGLFAALLLEVLSGDLPGLTAVLALAAPCFGLLASWWLGKLEMPGSRLREKLIRLAAPALSAGLFIAGQELIYLAYFYLTGMEIDFAHILRLLWAALLALLIALPVVPFVRGFVLRPADQTFIAKRREKRREKRKNRQARHTDKSSLSAMLKESFSMADLPAETEPPEVKQTDEQDG
ncbi:MAG: hypothetical protein LBM74_01610 [Oscillospiraceae bacterium]|jgi:hypothetical protein|nr:hypothetical protein [Oscillospiraceae bacterium]